MRLLCSVIGIPVSNVDRFRHYLPMCHWITSQFVGNDHPRAAADADCDASLSEQILYIPVAQVESIAKPESLPHEVLWVRHS
jgi:hypothetical protein